MSTKSPSIISTEARRYYIGTRHGTSINGWSTPVPFWLYVVPAKSSNQDLSVTSLWRFYVVCMVYYEVVPVLFYACFYSNVELASNLATDNASKVKFLQFLLLAYHLCLSNISTLLFHFVEHVRLKSIFNNTSVSNRFYHVSHVEVQLFLTLIAWIVLTCR